MAESCKFFEHKVIACVYVFVFVQRPTDTVAPPYNSMAPGPYPPAQNTSPYPPAQNNMPMPNTPVSKNGITHHIISYL